MTTTPTRRLRAGAAAAMLLSSLCAGIAAAQPPRILDAADHAELAAEMSADGVVRVALLDDRIARVIRLPQEGFAVEHDPSAGDLYLRPAAEAGASHVPDAPRGSAAPQALFVGTEKGSTYRMTLTPVEGGPAQILIRAVEPESGDPAPPAHKKDRVAAITGLIRAVASGNPPAGYAVEPADRDPSAEGGIVPLEVWRGPRHEALVLALGASAPADAPALAARFGTVVAAVWIAPAAGPLRGGGLADGKPLRGGGHAPGDPAAGRLAVVVREAGAR